MKTYLITPGTPLRRLLLCLVIVTAAIVMVFTGSMTIQVDEE